ncbi:uncharacterized protein L969DRAFT_80024 [Mixia osmundae IAM 14324]|uniref:Ubiquitin thioesterase OTU n=1 Tax=Mixia osmundae (strain CBS 9802 / IAM 14324 / JCM 22182 / KY 12970) TaxID=764103 RepID=G7DW72_MIXOS|nr:uncharacterized protein L969DRAFT_80024 [Mixia osmundae IAM 14324]KEI36536.1 hypothetical protein L969DRAFT_80024 [Mixia osmundae IAM 14324]GAA94760.1 hypothetical protein E5Q_01414 [Mixia osmundae IAM 14324]
MPVLRLRTPRGVHTLALDDAATLKDLLDAILEKAGLALPGLSVRFGYPPRALALDDASRPLSSLGIVNGEALIVSGESTSETAGAQVPSLAGPGRRSPTRATSAALPTVPPARGRPEALPAGKSDERRAKRVRKDIAASVYVPAQSGWLVLRVAPDDNACFFHALNMTLRPTQPGAASELRALVANTIMADPAKFDEATLGCTREEYARKISLPKSWGGAIDALAISDAVKVEVVAVDIQTGQMHRFGEDRGYEQRIILIYGGLHFDAVTFTPIEPSTEISRFPYDLSFDTTMFDLRDEWVLAAAAELAKDLRDKKYFTDVANFTLRCGQCFTGLVGEKEARQHASQTGHSSFEEYDK